MKTQSSSSAAPNRSLLEEVKVLYPAPSGGEQGSADEKEDAAGASSDGFNYDRQEPPPKKRRKSVVAVMEGEYLDDFATKSILKGIIASTTARIREMFFKGLPFPRTGIRLSGMITTKSPLFVPMHIWKLFYHRAIKDVDVSTRLGRTYWDYRFKSEGAALRFLRAEDMQARFVLNPAQPDNLESMRISSAVVSKAKPIILRYNTRFETVAWRFYVDITNGRNEII